MSRNSSRLNNLLPGPLMWGALLMCGGLLMACTQLDIDAVMNRDDGSVQPVTDPFILLGDTQEHEITGLPTPGINSGTIDRVLTEVTIRPPQQALFGRFLFDQILTGNTGMPVIHLGDLVDLSCRSELDRYADLLNEKTRAPQYDWGLVPGNHDGVALGNLNVNDNRPTLGFGAWGWDMGCRNPRAAPDLTIERVTGALLSRDDFLTWYIGQKADPQALARTEGDPATRDLANRWSGKTTASVVGQLVGKIVPRDGQKQSIFTNSFLVQKFSLPTATDSELKVSIIAFDTTQFGGSLDSTWSMAGSLGTSPGVMGYVQPDQIDAIRTLLRTQAPNEIILFAGHHDWDHIESRARRALAKVMADVANPIVYLSAHTHIGFWQRWRVGGRLMLELNVNSLADWPLGYRQVTVWSSRDRKRIRLKTQLMVPDGHSGPDGHSDRAVLPVSPEATDSTALLGAWNAACADISAHRNAFASELEHQFRLVRTHRMRRQGIITAAISLFFVPSPQLAERFLYEDKINDLSIAAYALADLVDAAVATGDGEHRAPDLKRTVGEELGKALQQINMSPEPANRHGYEKRLITAFGNGNLERNDEQFDAVHVTCRSGTDLKTCLRNMTFVRETLRKAPDGEDKPYLSLRSQYFELATWISGAQDALNAIKDPKARHYFACVAAAAAIADAAEQHGLGTHYDQIPLEPTFYLEAADAVDE